MTERKRKGLATLGWVAHWVLRVGLAVQLLVYGWSKVFQLQMGRPDVGQALVQYGEMSPMGLLWRTIGFSPAVQVLAGLAEVAAALLLLLRPAAGVGALLGAADMAVVLLVNMAYDVPVKQLALALLVGCLLVLVPYLPRYVRTLGAGALPAGRRPEAVPWPRLARVTRWTGPLLAVLLVGGSGLAGSTRAGAEEVVEPFVGVHRVVQDQRPPAAQLAEDDRWQQVALGQWLNSRGRGLAGVRTADGVLRMGSYQVVGEDTLEVELEPLAEYGRSGEVDQETFALTWTAQPDGTIRLVGDGEDVLVRPDPEARFLFDRDFSWAPRQPLNR